MEGEAKPRKSFSPGARWGIAFHVILATLAVLAIAAMLNYLATRYFTRINWSSRTTTDLSDQSRRILQTLTNTIHVSIVFDAQSEGDLYGLVSSLLQQYAYASPHLEVQTLDYTRHPGRAEMLLKQYKLDSLREKNFVVFECEGRTKVVPESEMADYQLQPVSGSQREFTRELVAFKGEMRFTSAVLAVAWPKSTRTYFLEGHREHSPLLTDHPYGYAEFAGLLKDENNIDWTTLSLQDTNEVPQDCALLIIAGPKMPFLESELKKINRYLENGGRALVMLNNLAVGPHTGIEEMLAKWNIAVADTVVVDPLNSTTPDKRDVLTRSLNDKHEITKSLFLDGLRIQLVMPRTVGEREANQRNAEAPKVTVLAGTGENGSEYAPRDGGLYHNPFLHRQGKLPLIVAAERGSIEGLTERGTRLVVVGDSLCFDNEMLDSAANRYFANMAVNWLTDRPQVLLEGLVPRPVDEYKLIMTDSQKSRVNWILLGALPGSVLAFGGLVWLRRRS